MDSAHYVLGCTIMRVSVEKVSRTTSTIFACIACSVAMQEAKDIKTMIQLAKELNNFHIKLMKLITHLQEQLQQV